MATAYRAGDDLYDEFPRQQRVLYECEPIYEDLQGWTDDISEVRSFDELPAAARAYCERVEELAGVRIGTVSVGPARAATIVK